MQFQVVTKVNQDFKKVKDGFNEDLFKALNPPFPPARLLRFDGSEKGDVVAVELNFFLFKQAWESLITEDYTDENEFYFVDEGKKLPFFLTYWRHKHIVLKDGNHALIIDDVMFKTKNKLMDYLMYPAVKSQFLYRRPIYKKYFS